MIKLFNFHRSDRPSFEIKEENLEKIEMTDLAKESIRIVDEPQMGYEDTRWIEKSNSIKARDNYTCQLCHAFNPMIEGGIFIKQGKYYTLHYYDRANSNYIIGVQDYDITINFDFYSGFHLVMPRLNVHHKIYYRNRELWDYNDDCLVTLCESCHHYIHSLHDVGIPIVEEQKDGNNILIGKTCPKPYHLDHTDLGTFQPFALVKENIWGLGLISQDLIDYRRAKNENKKWYDYHGILNNDVVHIYYLKSYDPRWNKYTPEEIEIVAKFIIDDFIGNILGLSQIQ